MAPSKTKAIGSAKYRFQRILRDNDPDKTSKSLEIDYALNRWLSKFREFDKCTAYSHEDRVEFFDMAYGLMLSYSLTFQFDVDMENIETRLRDNYLVHQVMEM